MSVQNLGEAEYVVSLYQYMRLRGYPAEKISILTTYNGQKALIRDVVESRCAGHPAFGRPLKVMLMRPSIKCIYRIVEYGCFTVCSSPSLHLPQQRCSGLVHTAGDHSRQVPGPAE